MPDWVQIVRQPERIHRAVDLAAVVAKCASGVVRVVSFAVAAALEEDRYTRGVEELGIV